jgi:putative iron-only hydrogenase system regulator
MLKFYAPLYISGAFLSGGSMEEKRIAVTAIVIDDMSAVDEVNAVLHQFNEIIIGRMGIPYRERGVSVISVALDAEPDKISCLTGKLGHINGVSVKSAISKK